MATDITELAQSLKRRAASANEFGESLYVKGADVIALVEALKKAQTKAIEQGRTSCELFDEVTALRQRIAELESRSVKLPSELELRNNEVCSVCAGNALQVIEDKLTAAGIKWEAE
ncbi:hypothetical protein N7692_26060 [Klebsiella michiganensis]|uniref:hypothetical protein n=1 Tax=Klebsiella michiganensis TaxID=1134687 RepID=UPI0024471DB6|nr:hypothetical protein [Klebsiella michiganensis]MDH0491069.1 hypothetical protein [Klebsiella michiganensis]